MPKDKEQFYNRLKRLIKKSQLKRDTKSIFNASFDNTKYSFLPDAVLFVKDAKEVGTALKLANEYKIPITPRGAGTGCCGGALPNYGGLVLDFSKFNKIKIDTLSKTAIVQSGAINFDINKAANEFGLFYPPDPSSTKYSTIGGNIACNAGGLRACKYGVTENYVMAIEGYTPMGNFISCGRPLKKFSAGYNTKGLFIASEGTLAIITKAKLKLIDLPKESLACLAFFDSDMQAFEAVEEILRSSLQPSIFEFMDSQSVSAAFEYESKDNSEKQKAAILLEFDGEDIAHIEKSFSQLSKLKCGNNFRYAKDKNESEELWKIRRICSQASYKYGNTKLNQDIVLPPQSVCKFFKIFKGQCNKYKLASPTFGHAGDGNYHIHIMFNGDNKNDKKLAQELMEFFIKKTIELGGAISGEHGIGLAKTKYMGFQHTKESLAMMKSIKKALDPNDILNRGKVLEIFNFKGKEPIKDLKLPWEKK